MCVCVRQSTVQKSEVGRTSTLLKVYDRALRWLREIGQRMAKIGLKDAYLHDESVTDVVRCLLNRRSVGPDRLCVRDNRARTNNILGSYHSGLRRRIQVSHPNFFDFLTHLQKCQRRQHGRLAAPETRR